MSRCAADFYMSNIDIEIQTNIPYAHLSLYSIPSSSTVWSQIHFRYTLLYYFHRRFKNILVSRPKAIPYLVAIEKSIKWHLLAWHSSIFPYATERFKLGYKITTVGCADDLVLMNPQPTRWFKPFPIKNQFLDWFLKSVVTSTPCSSFNPCYISFIDWYTTSLQGKTHPYSSYCRRSQVSQRNCLYSHLWK